MNYPTNAAIKLFANMLKQNTNRKFCKYFFSRSIKNI